MRRIEIDLPEVALIEVPAFSDDRGFLMETHHQQKFAELGVADTFVQDNHSRSQCGTLRGLHYQLRRPQAKLVRVAQGAVFDVAIDIREGSPTFARWYGCELSEDNRLQLYVPAGFAHGFCVLSAAADVLYKCSEVYVPGDQYGIAWDDPQLGIEWPFAQPLLSDRDAVLPRLEAARAAGELPRFA
ncbi:MAG: dTDP-4-dehydrorhamnose 3,5-epimerase [Gammaproteobacteria bacterium]